MEPLVSPHLKEFWEFNEGTALSVVWEAFKVSTQVMYVSAIKAARVEQNSKPEELQAHELSCAQTPADSPSPTSLAELQMVRWALLVNFQNLTQCVFKHQGKNCLKKVTKMGNCWPS